MLNKRSISATFFVVGAHAEKHLGIVRAAFEAGHRIGNHSYTHPYLTHLDRPKIREEVARTDAVIAEFAGPEKVFRPPYGDRNAEVDAVAQELGYRTIMWNASTRDWSAYYQPKRWVSRGKLRVRLAGKSTVLLHDLPGTAQHLGDFIDAVQKLRNVRFMPAASLDMA